MKTTISFLLLFFAFNTYSANVAIIDSGTDYQHEQIVKYQWINAFDIENSRDDDSNGYIDDIYGWNFAEKNNKVIDYSFLGTFSSDCHKFFEIQLKGFLGTITEEEKKWIEEKRKDSKFINELSTFGNFVHGTHVTGISVSGSKNNKVLAIKLLPTKINGEGEEREEVATLKNHRIKFSPREGEESNGSEVKNPFAEMLLRMLLSQAAQQQMTQLTDVAKYIHGHKMEVANGSFGVGYKNAKDLVKQVYKQMVGQEATEEKADELTRFFLDENLKYGKGFVGAAPNTLFVFAAGNDGSNNDLFPSSPTNIKTDNVISVAATVGFERIAPFSNYGILMVDVAAPGVGINSAIPSVNHDEYLVVSGTSQAAPYVTNVAGEIKEINPKLTPKQVKEIIMKTVDYKSFLKDKVKSGGIVNNERAQYAAELSKSSDLTTAIEESREKVRDSEDETFKSMGTDFLDAVYPIQFPPMYHF